MKLLLENWRKYLEEDALEEGLLDFFKKKEIEGEVVPPIPREYIKSLRKDWSRKLYPGLGWRDRRGPTPYRKGESDNRLYADWYKLIHADWMEDLEKSADNGTLSLKTAQVIADKLLSVQWRRSNDPKKQEAMDMARETIKSDFSDLFIRLGAQKGGLSVLPPEEGEGALSYADSEGGLSMTEQWRKYLNEVDTPSDSSDNLAAAAKKTIEKNGEAALLDVFASLPDDIKSQMQAIAKDIAIKTSKEEINEEFDDYYETPYEEDKRKEQELDILTTPAILGAAMGMGPDAALAMAAAYITNSSPAAVFTPLVTATGLGAGLVAGIIGVLVYRMLQDKARRPDSIKPRQENPAE